MALHRVRLMGELERLLLDTVRAIAATIDAKDGYTHRHSERVAALASRIAAELGLGGDNRRVAELVRAPARRREDRRAGFDPQQAGQPRPSKSSPRCASIRCTGREILANIKSPLVAAVLPGVQVPPREVGWRRLSRGPERQRDPAPRPAAGVADFLDALTSARPYHAAMLPDEAIDLVRKGSGTHFDPRIADVAVRLHAAGDLLPSNWDELGANRDRLMASAPPATDG